MFTPMWLIQMLNVLDNIRLIRCCQTIKSKTVELLISFIILRVEVLISSLSSNSLKSDFMGITTKIDL